MMARSYQMACRLADAKIRGALSMAALLFVACLVSAGARESSVKCGPGRWSTEAIDLSSRKVKAPYEDRDIRVYSSDRKKSFHVVNHQWWVKVGEKRISPPKKLSELLYPAEMAWAPDSSAFFLTSSIGYSTGYRAQVYRVAHDKLIPITRLSGVVQKDFERHHRCFDAVAGVGNAPNLAGFKWLGGSDRLLVVAEVPPIGICKEQEYFGGYKIALPSGQIVQRLSPQQLSDQWADTLGERLKSNLEYLSPEAKATVP